MPRRATVAAANCASAGLVVLIPVTETLPQLYALGAAIGLVETLLRPASFALLPEVFPERQLYRVNAAQEALDAISNLAGPALAVALVTTVGVGWAFAVDGASYLVAALSLLALRPLPPAERRTEPLLNPGQGGDAASFGTVWRLLRRDGSLALLLAVNMVYSVGIGALLVLFAPLALGVLDVGEWGYGLLVTATGVGALAGVLLAPRLGPRLTPRALLLPLVASGILLVAAASLRDLWAVAALLALAHAPESLCYLTFATESQRRVPTRLLGRYHGLAMTTLAAALPLGSLGGGLLLAWLGPPVGVAIVGLAFVGLAFMVAAVGGMTHGRLAARRGRP